MNSTRAIQRINEYIMNQGNEAEEVLQPVELDDLKENHKLCGTLIDFLGDIYVCSGMNKDYSDNECGSEIQQLITFIAGFVFEELS